MKKIYIMLAMLLTAAAISTSCSENEDPFTTAGEGDYPRILNPYFADWTNGVPGVFKNMTRDQRLQEEVIVTPMDYTTVKWYIDDNEVAEGLSIDLPLLAGEYLLKVVATTVKGLETCRMGRVIVRPCDGDPVPEVRTLERLVAPGVATQLHGANMDKVAKVIIGTTQIAAHYRADDGGYAEYTVPNIPDGNYQLTVADSKGFVYGAGTIVVSSSPVIGASYFEAKAGAEVVVEGQNLDKVASISVGGKNCTVKTQTGQSLTFVVAELAAGPYDLKATDKSGKAVKFVSGNDLTDVAKFVVTAETAVWTGSFSVTWGTPFDALQTTMRSLVHAGTIVRIYVNGEGQGACTTAWWNNILTGESDPNRGDITISGEQVLEYVLTDLSLSLMEAQDGFLVVGDGYAVTKVTIE